MLTALAAKPYGRYEQFKGRTVFVPPHGKRPFFTDTNPAKDLTDAEWHDLVNVACAPSTYSTKPMHAEVK